MIKLLMPFALLIFVNNMGFSQLNPDQFKDGAPYIHAVRLESSDEKNIAVVNYDKLGRVSIINEYYKPKDRKNFVYAKSIIYYRDANNHLSSIRAIKSNSIYASDLILNDMNVDFKYDKNWQLSSSSNGGKDYFQYTIQKGQILKINRISPESSEVQSSQEITYNSIGVPVFVKRFNINDGRPPELTLRYDDGRSFGEELLIDNFKYPLHSPFNFIEVSYLHNPAYNHVEYTYDKYGYVDFIITTQGKDVIRKYYLNKSSSRRFTDIDALFAANISREIYIEPYSFIENDDLVEQSPSFESFIGTWRNCYTDVSLVHTIEINPASDNAGKPLKDHIKIAVQMIGNFSSQSNYRYNFYYLNYSLLKSGILEASDPNIKFNYTFSKMVDGRLRLAINTTSPFPVAGTKEQHYIMYFRK